MGPTIADLTRTRPFGVTRKEILGRYQCRRTSRARFAVAWVARKKLGRTFPVIGRALRRDHSTIINAVRRAEEMRERDSAFRAMTDWLAGVMQ